MSPKAPGKAMNVRINIDIFDEQNRRSFEVGEGHVGFDADGLLSGSAKILEVIFFTHHR